MKNRLQELTGGKLIIGFILDVNIQKSMPLTVAKKDK
jgi:hypothetical protein